MCTQIKNNSNDKYVQKSLGTSTPLGVNKIAPIDLDYLCTNIIY